ncbi:disease resistance protein SUMM2 [Fagus crenata]
MDLVRPILDIASCLWNCTTNQAKYICGLEENLELLTNRMNDLNNLSQEVRRRVAREEMQQMRRTERVNGWLQRVEGLERQVEVILQNDTEELQKKCLLNCFPRNCNCSYRLGKAVSKKIIAVSDAINKADFDVVAYQLPRAPVDEMPMENITVGLEPLLQEVWSCLDDKNVRIIGLYGIGGVGKTTLLKMINNEFRNQSHNFDVVIWVVASKEVNMEKIQEVIRKKLEISDQIWDGKSEEERPGEILRVLRTRRFMLLIDDIWEQIDLANLGIPLLNHENLSKVVFTTRSKDVCGLMEAERRIKVECLAREEALNLFQKKVGEETLRSHPDIPELAKIAAEECEGLPLALITIGRAMCSKKTPRDWNHAISVLRSFPSEFSGMGNKVFPVLKFSYDYLPCEKDRNCFLFCSLFLEGYNIRKDELINLWIGEGLLDGYCRNMHEAFNLGEVIVEILKQACLLESDESEEFVRMHDMIRDMALWVANTSGREGNKILVQHVGLNSEADSCEKWNEAERISVWGHHNSIESFTGEPLCPNLLTLLVKDTMLKTFSNEFFQSMHALKVLDLSGNRGLTELPKSIGKLLNLEYLNLSETAIMELPSELKELRKLKFLLLDYTKTLKEISKEGISSLSCLQVFSMVTDEFYFNGSETALYDEQALLEELECLKLGELRITIRSASGAKKVMESPMLQKCLKKLSINNCCKFKRLKLSSSALKRMNRLVKLEITFCKGLHELKIINDTRLKRNLCFRSLHEVVIRMCDLIHATWLIYAPCLQKLTIADCSSMATVATYTLIEDDEIFSSLQTLHLQNLPSLKSICPQALRFPALIEIHVDQCKSLRELPLNAGSASRLKQIKGTKSWWNQLRWTDSAIKEAFSSKFIEIPNYDQFA